MSMQKYCYLNAVFVHILFSGKVLWSISDKKAGNTTNSLQFDTQRVYHSSTIKPYKIIATDIFS